jgi:hypothetical protein
MKAPQAHEAGLTGTHAADRPAPAIASHAAIPASLGARDPDSLFDPSLATVAFIPSLRPHLLARGGAGAGAGEGGEAPHFEPEADPADALLFRIDLAPTATGALA